MVAELHFFMVIWYVIIGLVIGALARLLLPGKQEMGMLMTMVIGVVGAILGGFLWELVFTNHGIAWIGSIIAAMVLVWAYERFVASGKSKRASGPAPSA